MRSAFGHLHHAQWIHNPRKIVGLQQHEAEEMQIALHPSFRDIFLPQMAAAAAAPADPWPWARLLRRTTTPRRTLLRQRRPRRTCMHILVTSAGEDPGSPTAAELADRSPRGELSLVRPGSGDPVELLCSFAVLLLPPSSRSATQGPRWRLLSSSVSPCASPSPAPYWPLQRISGGEEQHTLIPRPLPPRLLSLSLSFLPLPTALICL
jgi:hypothetical protein